jgi:hypothetical protein
MKAKKDIMDADCKIKDVPFRFRTPALSRKKIILKEFPGKRLLL